MITIQLTSDEWTAAESIGLKRQALRLQRGKSPVEYRDGGGTHNERNGIGSVAEYATAKHYGPDVLRDWCENKSFSLQHHLIPCDVGKSLHVRSTKLSHGGLIAHDYDPNTGVFILAIADKAALTVTLIGWDYGANVKKKVNWKDTGSGFGRRPAYCAGQDSLRPMDTIPPEAIR